MKRSSGYQAIGLVVAGLLLNVQVCVLAGGQSLSQQNRKNQDDEPIRLGTTLVQVPVTVRESGGRYVSDLKESEFTILEDGVKQSIAFFGSVEEPFSVALLLDSSGSTSAQLEIIKSAALAFIDTLRPRDRAMVISFDDSVKIQCELTSDVQKLKQAVMAISPGEYTQVYEAVYTAVWEKLHDVEGRKAVIVFTDGIDTASSEIDDEDTYDAIIDSEDILVYPIRYSTRADVERRLERKGQSPGPTTKTRLDLDHTYRQADEYLDQLARMSGGVLERADALGDLKAAFGRIAEELRHQYLLGYYPIKKDRSPQTRKISIQVSRPGAKVRARPEYRLSQ
jgi:Ca-activated chloride channel homolog